MGTKKHYAQIGMGIRSLMYIEALTGEYKEHCELVAICDINQGRMDLCNCRIEARGCQAVKTYHADQFDRMVSEKKPDVIIVTSPDATHCNYICRAMELGCDVITEKPMTVDEMCCQRIQRAIEKTGRKLQVTFNYRYSPYRSQLKEILTSGAVGEVLSIDFAWLLDTYHGADYFRRWHRRRENSGSLLVHKSTHHFDAVNWWLGDIPEEVFCEASLSFYIPSMADKLGLKGRSDRCYTCPCKESCKFFLNIEEGTFKEMYLDCETDDGYIRDKCVFSDETNIWDNMAVTVRYKHGTLLSYTLNAYSPYEGHSIAFNGTKGRLEQFCRESSYISGDGKIPGRVGNHDVTITLIPSFSQPRRIEPRVMEGGHGGGDPMLLRDIFDPYAPSDPLQRKADYLDGASSILVGIAAYKSIDSGTSVKISDLIPDGAGVNGGVKLQRLAGAE